VPAEAPATLQTRSLAALPRSATKFESGTLPTNDEFRQLLEGSSRVGGARPKALLHDEDGEWIAKFPSRARDGAHDVVGLEATCLDLARLRVRAGKSLEAVRTDIQQRLALIRGARQRPGT
jgi:serine/threonine-protein kinase HipA